MVSSQQLKHWRSEAIARALMAGIDPHEVDWLLQRVTNLTRLELRLESYLTRETIESQKSLAELKKLWEERINTHLPLQYLLGVADWRDFQLEVTPGVLIPRPETEIIIDIVLEIMQSNSNLDLASGIWVDLGTGSGAIALGLAQILPQGQIYGIDFSEIALNVAKTNAKNLNLEQRITFKQGNWLSPLEHLKGKISAIITNPPYIPSSLIPQLQPEVRLHEPHLALDGGENGLNCIEYLIDTGAIYLHSGGIWLSEIMVGQSESVRQLLVNQGQYENIQIFTDLAQIDRFVLAYKK
jgi:release factor glutamine methyltransferase